MGILRRLKDQITDATTTAAEIRGDMSRWGGSVGAGTPAPTMIPNPTPQEDGDRLLAAGANARGVVIGSRHDMSDGDRSAHTRVHVRVRPRLTGGALGEEVALEA